MRSVYAGADALAVAGADVRAHACPFADFAADSVRKYFSAIDAMLADDALPVTRDQLLVMTPFATVVAA